MMAGSSLPCLEAYMTRVLDGDRNGCRRIFETARRDFDAPLQLFTDLIWPAMERTQQLYRQDRINTTIEHMATRINRQLADQVRQYLSFPQPNGRKIVMMCADHEPEELGGQMTADLFEAQGWKVFFLGGGVPNDEVMSFLGQINPDLLLIFGTMPQGVPGIRKLIDTMREIGMCSTMNVLISGGVFNRADGLWEEVNADLYAPNAVEALKIANQAEPRKPQPLPIGGTKKRRRRRRSPYLANETNTAAATA